jgi:hypothetical protein
MSSLRQPGYELTFAPALELEPVEMDVTALDAIGAREAGKGASDCIRCLFAGAGGPRLRPRVRKMGSRLLLRAAAAQVPGCRFRAGAPRGGRRRQAPVWSCLRSTRLAN